MPAKQPVGLPKKVRGEIELLWEKDLAHAAKQAFCFFLDHTKAFEFDHNQVVDYGIATGILAEQMRHAGPLAFITAYEATILKM